MDKGVGGGLLITFSTPMSRKIWDTTQTSTSALTSAPLPSVLKIRLGSISVCWPPATTASSPTVGLSSLSSLRVISSQGTFGLWGALLAGGHVIAAKGRNNETVTEEDEIYLRSDMPGWLYVDTRDEENIEVLQINSTTHTFSRAQL